MMQQNTSNEIGNPTAKNEKTYDAFSFHVYSKIFPRFDNFIWYLYAGITGLVLIGLYFLESETSIWFLYTGITLTGLFALRLLIEFLRKLFTYSSYKEFSHNLGFELKGWDKLGSFPKQLKRHYWSGETSIEIIPEQNISGQELKYLEDAMYLFVSRANSRFYESEIGGDGRTEWKSRSPFYAKGSSDVSVISDIYFLINVYLRGIQKSHPVIKRVNVKFGSEIFLVNPPRHSD